MIPLHKRNNNSNKFTVEKDAFLKWIELEMKWKKNVSRISRWSPMRFLFREPLYSFCKSFLAGFRVCVYINIPISFSLSLSLFLWLHVFKPFPISILNRMKTDWMKWTGFFLKFLQLCHEIPFISLCFANIQYARKLNMYECAKCVFFSMSLAREGALLS